MASLQCSNCKNGIHYHGEPNGVQHIIIKKSVWQVICSSTFDPKAKVLNDKTGYPKLYRTDTIEEDFKENLEFFWICPYCQTILFFDKTGVVTETYSPDIQSQISNELDDFDSLLFDDYEWDAITELAAPVSKLLESQKNINQLCKKGDYIYIKRGDVLTKYKRNIPSQVHKKFT